MLEKTPHVLCAGLVSGCPKRAITPHFLPECIARNSVMIFTAQSQAMSLKRLAPTPQLAIDAIPSPVNHDPFCTGRPGASKKLRLPKEWRGYRAGFTERTWARYTTAG